MHASGAIATKLAPFAALAVWPASGAPWWAAAVLAGIGLLQIATDIGVSTKSSDWKKFRREGDREGTARRVGARSSPRGTGADHRRVAIPTPAPPALLAVPVERQPG